MLLTSRGNPAVRLIVPDDAPEAERHAAGRLRAYVQQMSGAVLPVEPEISDGPVVLIGRALATAELPPDFSWEVLGEDGIVLGTVGNRLIVAGPSPRGTLHAVYELLERLGCRWLAPGEYHIPDQDTLDTGILDVVHRPSFRYREPHFGILDDPEWCLANRANARPCLEERHGGRIAYARDFVHNLYNLVPPEEFFQEHPEYYSEVNGERTCVQAQLCLSNPEVLDIATERVRDVLRENPDASIMTISQEDHDGHCTCAECRQIDEREGSPSGTLIRFVNSVAERLEPEFPEVLFDTLAYTYTVEPPRTIRPRENVIIRLCNMGGCDCYPLRAREAEAARRFVRLVHEWGEIAHEVFVWTYVTNFHHYFQPYPNLDAMFDDFGFYADAGVTGLMLQGDAGPSKGCGELAELKSYVFSRLMWDHTRDGWALVDEFLRLYYGAAAEPIRDYLDHLHEPFRSNRDLSFSLYEPLMHPVFTPAWIHRARELFDEAERCVEGDSVLLERVRAARLPVDYLTWKPNLHFEVQPDAYGAADAELAGLARQFMARARSRRAKSLREGGPPIEEAERFLEDHPIVWLGEPGGPLRVGVVPDIGGRLVSLRRDGEEWLHQAHPEAMDYPVAGGYEEYIGLGWRSPGWSEPYEWTCSEDSVQLHAELAGGLRFERTYVLKQGGERPALRIESILTATEEGGDLALIRAHPIFTVGEWETLPLQAREADGTWRDLTPPQTPDDNGGREWLEDDRLPAGAWALRRGENRLVMEFQPDQVWRCLLGWDREEGTVAPETYSNRARLQSGESLSLQQLWRFE